MKFCFRCKTKKDLERFSKDKSRKDGKYPTCMDCVMYYQNSSAYKEIHIKAKANYRKTTGYKISRKKYRKSEKGKLSESRYRKNNRGTVNFYTAKRRAAKLKATPKWLTYEHLEQIKDIYKNCPNGYEVDHIEPLQGESLCGLHVPWNLQYLLKSENRSKGNKRS